MAFLCRTCVHLNPVFRGLAFGYPFGSLKSLVPRVFFFKKKVKTLFWPAVILLSPHTDTFYARRRPPARLPLAPVSLSLPRPAWSPFFHEHDLLQWTRSPALTLSCSPSPPPCTATWIVPWASPHPWTGGLDPGSDALDPRSSGLAQCYSVVRQVAVA
jgi:hypothetical protein